MRGRLYNLLDLPQRQTTGEGTVVDYKYAFDGRKLQEKVTGPVYMFFLRDHLGSVRAVVSETGAVQQRNNYFPYGDLFPNTSIDSSANRYRYTGKESGDEIGLYDFSARFLQTSLGRFTTIDPLAEQYPNISPYAYCNGNPVNYIDPDGMACGDPVRNPEIRRNRASNLYGEGIRYLDGQMRNHQGFDYYAPIGTDVLAVQNGVVVQSGGDHKDYGQSVTIEHTIDNGNFYAHLSEVNVNDVVSEGQIIAKSGDTGNAGSPNVEDQHLHFELRSQPGNAIGLNGKINPNEIVDTKFISQYPESNEQNKVGILKINTDGTIEIRDLFW